MEKEDRTYERINNYIASIILGVSFCTLIILLSMSPLEKVSRADLINITLV